jgi:hypothetical protein
VRSDRRPQSRRGPVNSRRRLRSEHKIKLYRSYLSRAACYVPRHRGKSPHQAAYFTRSLRIQQEAAVLASFFALAGLVPTEPSAAAGINLPNIARGDSLCTAFETYAILILAPSISRRRGWVACCAASMTVC